MKDITENSITGYDSELDVSEIIADENLDSFEEAVYICDLSDIVKKYATWISHLPRVTPFYAVKCNDHPVILKILKNLGTGFDCASKGEINKVIDFGVAPERIIFANPTKPKSHLTHALANGVTTMTFDNDFELYKIQKTFPHANLVLRIKCEAKIAQCPLGDKYGCDPDTEAPGLINLVKRLNLKLVGISFHVGSGCWDFPVYERAIQKSRLLFDYAKTMGFNLALLDIGGGFPGDKGTSIDKVSSIVNSALDKYFPNDDVKIIAEPGRFFVSSAYTLVCKIHSKREIIDKEGVHKYMYYINDGVYGSFNCVLYDHQVATPLFISNSQNALFKSSIWGPTCDALDKICESVLLPNMDIGDNLVFENMGAYTLPIASPFNGFPLPTVKFYIKSDDEELMSHY